MTENLNINFSNFEEPIGTYRGSMGPFEDEITILRYKNKNPNAPIYNGAYKKVQF